MATFVVLPPRSLVLESFAGWLEQWLPTGRFSAADLAHVWDQMVELLQSQQPPTYLVHREDLPEGEPVVQALHDGFGAEPSDRIVEVAFTPRLYAKLASRDSQFPQAAASVASAALL